MLRRPVESAGRLDPQRHRGASISEGEGGAGAEAGEGHLGCHGGGGVAQHDLEGHVVAVAFDPHTTEPGVDALGDGVDRLVVVGTDHRRPAAVQRARAVGAHADDQPVGQLDVPADVLMGQQRRVQCDHPGDVW